VDEHINLTDSIMDRCVGRAQLSEWVGLGGPAQRHRQKKIIPVSLSRWLWRIGPLQP
jgi:hypothetical protein